MIDEIDIISHLYNRREYKLIYSEMIIPEYINREKIIYLFWE